jgi:Uma2 family endonuclease
VLPQTRKLTIEDFNALPEGPPFYEFEEGELIQMPSPTIAHQDIILEMGGLVSRHVRSKKLGRAFIDVDVYLPDGRVYVPDIGFLSTEKLDMVSSVDGKIHGAPTLVVEVTSSDETRDRGRKFHVYHANGVEWLWLVSQSLLIEEYQSTDGVTFAFPQPSQEKCFNPSYLRVSKLTLRPCSANRRNPLKRFRATRRADRGSAAPL